VGNGKAQWAQAFVEETKPGFAVYVDPGRETYKAAELKRSRLAALGPKAVLNGVRAFSQGYRQSAQRGDNWQQGGVVVVDREGSTLYQHADDVAGDHASIPDILAALGA